MHFLVVLISFLIAIPAFSQNSDKAPNNSTKYPRPSSIWALGEIYGGFQKLSTSLPGEANKSGYNLGLGGVLAFYNQNWVSDFGVGFRYSSLKGTLNNIDTKIYTQSGIMDFGIRHRSGAFNIGPIFELHFGTDNTYSERPQSEVTLLLIGGVQLHWDSLSNGSLYRYGTRLQTDFNLGSQQIYMGTIFFQMGFALDDPRPKRRMRDRNFRVSQKKPVMPTPVAEVPLVPIPAPLPLPPSEPVQAQITGARQVTLRLSDRILFDTAMSHLKGPSKKYLEKLANLLNQNEKDWEFVDISGHADKRGTSNVNLVLSEARAKSVTDYLVSLGVEKSRTVYSGRGEREPLDPAENLEAYARNRRVELKFDGVSDESRFVKDIDAIPFEE